MLYLRFKKIGKPKLPFASQRSFLPLLVLHLLLLLLPRHQISPPSPSTQRQRASPEEEAFVSTKAEKSTPLSPSTSTAAAALARLTTVTPPQAPPPPRPGRGGGSSGSSSNNARLSSPLSSLEEPLSGSSTTKSQRGWRRGRGRGNDASSTSNLLAPLARPASSAALLLRVLGDDEEEESSLPLTIVTDDYALGRVLGRGQFGTTRMATRRDDNQLFACKIILKRKLSTPSAVAAVRREIAILKKLDHSSIVKLEGAYEDDRVSSFRGFSFLFGAEVEADVFLSIPLSHSARSQSANSSPFLIPLSQKAVHLVVELCQGGELLEAIARNGKFSERCAAARARSILETVGYLHNKVREGERDELRKKQREGGKKVTGEKKLTLSKQKKTKQKNEGCRP